MGRPPGSGQPPQCLRRNRVVVMLRDDEVAELERLAGEQGIPLGTMLYQLVKRRLRRRR